MGLYRVYIFGLMPMTAFMLLFWMAAQDDCRERLALGAP